jgi:hypothetical protein
MPTLAAMRMGYPVLPGRLIGLEGGKFESLEFRVLLGKGRF